MGGERTSDSDVEDEEPIERDLEVDPGSHTHTDQPEFHKEPLRAVEPQRSLMHRTDSGSGTMIPCTDSGSGAVISNQKGPSADSENDSEPGATKKPRAIYGSRAMMPGTDSGPRDMNSNSNAERIDPKRDLQIASGSNGQRPGRILRPTFKVWENQLITNILQQSIDLRNRHTLMVLIAQCTEDADPKEPKTLEEALSGLNKT